ncbi:MAG: hypothetical protein Q4C20_01405 [Erysipelotrichaceae bacterium]|nr:hypothetical protein [Erysipelotrichaceae bacterium]
MPLTAAKCPNCGGTLQVDASQRLAVCPFCKQPYVVEEAINNYITNYNIENMHAETVNIIGGKTADDFAKSGDTNLKLQRYSEAKDDFEKITKDYPYDYRGWWGLIRLKTNEFNSHDIKWPELCQLRQYYKNILKVGNYPSNIRDTYEQFDRRMTNELNGESENLNIRMMQIESKRKNAIASLQNLKNELELQKAHLSASKEKIQATSDKILKIINIATIILAVIGILPVLVVDNPYTNKFWDLLQGLFGLGFLYLVLLGVIYYPLTKGYETKENFKNKKLEQYVNDLQKKYDFQMKGIDSEYTTEMERVRISDIHNVLGQRITYLDR